MDRRLDTLQILGPLVVEHRTKEAVTALRRLREQAGKDRELLDWIDRATRLEERILELGPRIPINFHCASRGYDYWKAYYYRRLYVATALLWSAVFDVDPAVADRLDDGNRYNAACAAALAGCGKGKDDPAPDDVTKAKFRQRALDWLQADLSARRKALESGPASVKGTTADTLSHWKQDVNLAGVRDEADLKKLTEAERKAWQAFWAEVVALLKATEKS